MDRISLTTNYGVSYLIRVKAERLEAILGLVDHARDKEQRRVRPTRDRVVKESADHTTRLPEHAVDFKEWVI